MRQATACGDNTSPNTSQKRWDSTCSPRLPLPEGIPPVNSLGLLEFDAILGEPGQQVMAAGADEAASAEPGVIGDLGDRLRRNDSASRSVLNSTSAMIRPCSGGSKTSMPSGATLSRVLDSTAAGSVASRSYSAADR